jgi:uncharacterized membrane protein
VKPDRIGGRPGEPRDVAPNRLESFSDGVIAVAITLLVLGIGTPPVHDPHLTHDLLQQWPEYAAYVVSFLTIGIIWINHHAMIARLREVDQPILILNLVLLMTIGLLPFATDVLAKHRDASPAAAVYSGAFLLMAIAFATLNRHILLVKDHLHHTPLPLERRRVILTRSVSGVVPYAVATGLAFVSPYLTLAICAALAAFYATPIASGP